MKAHVCVTLKQEVLDPQGDAVRRALASMGYDEVSRVRVGKLIEIDIADGDPKEAKDRLHAMCESLLANPVIEDFQVDIHES